MVLSSAILTSFLRWDAFSFNVSSSERNFHSKKILKCSEMSVCIKAVFKTQILKLHAEYLFVPGGSSIIL